MRLHLRSLALLLLTVAGGCTGGVPPDVALSADALGTAGPGTIVLEGANIPSRGTFKVTVTDADANLDPTSLDGVVVHVSVTRAGVTGPSIPALLVETAESAGVFTAGLPVPATVQDDDTVNVTYRDPNAGNCTPAFVTASAKVDAYGADLYFPVDSIVADETVVVGEPFHVSGFLANDGRGAAAGASAICARLTRPGWDSEGYEIVEVFELGHATVGALQPGGAPVPFAFSGVVPLNSNSNPLTLELVADCDHQVPEFNEDNNVYKRTLGVVGPDLVVDPGFVVSPAGTVIAGHPLEVHGTVRNLGGARAVATTVKARIHRPAHDDEGYPIDETYEIGSAPVLSLGGGDSQPFTVSFTVPEGLNGGFTVEVYVDPDRRVIESNEANNATPAAQQPAITVTGADLTVTIDATTPAGVVAGQPLVVTGHVRNAAGGARAGASTVYVRFHRPSKDDEGYDIDESYDVGRASIAPLDPDGFVEFTVTTIVPQNLAGSFTLEAMADAGWAVAETNEQNNRATQGLGVVGADLTVDPVSVPTDASAGALYQIQVKVKNAPGGEAALASTVGATLYRRSCCDDEGYSYDEWYVLVPEPVSSLDPGDEQFVTLSGTIPAGATRAAFTLSVTADSQWVVQESDESNNSWSTQVTVR